MSTAIIVFVRKPELGKVKTRLAKGVGEQRAFDIYVELLKYTAKQVEATVHTVYVYYHHEVVPDDMWDSSRCHKVLQVDGDLGDKLRAAFTEVLSQHDKAIVVGSDCPRLTTAIIDTAVDSLDHQDVVIGPTLDGGYYLLGMKAYTPTLLTGVPWSSGDEYDYTVHASIAAGQSVHVLAPLPDVDYAEDWEKYGWEF
jgi:rSAM/selenodomain-associated transferase 1